MADGFALTNDGTLQGSVTETRTGASSGGERGYFAVNADKERHEYLERRLRQDFSDVALTSEGAENVQDMEGKFIVHYQITAPAYAKHAGDLLLVRPRVLGLLGRALDDKPRKYPIDLEVEGTWRDSFTVTLPDGYSVDEVPDPMKVDVGFASYQSEVKAGKHEIQYSRELIVKKLDLAPGDYDSLRKLEGAITTDEHSNAVLKKQ